MSGVIGYGQKIPKVLYTFNVTRNQENKADIQGVSIIITSRFVNKVITSGESVELSIDNPVAITLDAIQGYRTPQITEFTLAYGSEEAHEAKGTLLYQQTGM